MTFDWHADGTVYIQSSVPLQPYPQNLTDCLIHWAGVAPERVFLAQRSAGGSWRTITYSQALQRVLTAAQTLLSAGSRIATPLTIATGNSIEHALQALACLHVGVPYVPLSPKCRPVWKTEPGTSLGIDVEEAHARVTGDTIGKILWTSGSIGPPKGVITTHQMLCSNQQMIRTALPSLADEPPVLCDWLPWHHVFGGSHNFGIALYNGGSLYIDEGTPTAVGFEATLHNLRDIAPTAYFNVPKGYRLLLPALKTDRELRRRFFSRLRVVFCAAASIDAETWEDLRKLAREPRGDEVQMRIAIGATETAPMALLTQADARAGEVGLPVPGVTLKLVPWRSHYEARLRGPSVTPGYWQDAERTAAAFDNEGFYKTGDALDFVRRSEPEKGLLFAGRLDGICKLPHGLWPIDERGLLK